MKSGTAATTLVCVALVASAQTSAPSLSFEAASVKMVDSSVRTSGGATGGPGTNDPGRYHVPRALMIQLLPTAFGVGADQIVGAPAWARTIGGPDQYEVTATMPPTTTKEQFQVM